MQDRKKNNKKAFLVKKIAEKHGCSTRLVYLVLAGDRENEDILADYMTAQEEIDQAIENLQNNPLMSQVLKAVPFN